MGKFTQDNISSGLLNPHIIPQEACLGQDIAGAGRQVCISKHQPLPPTDLYSIDKLLRKQSGPWGTHMLLGDRHSEF